MLGTCSAAHGLPCCSDFPCHRLSRRVFQSANGRSAGCNTQPGEHSTATSTGASRSAMGDDWPRCVSQKNVSGTSLRRISSYWSIRANR